MKTLLLLFALSVGAVLAQAPYGSPFFGPLVDSTYNPPNCALTPTLTGTYAAGNWTNYFVTLTNSATTPSAVAVCWSNGTVWIPMMESNTTNQSLATAYGTTGGTNGKLCVDGATSGNGVCLQAQSSQQGGALNPPSAMASGTFTMPLGVAGDGTVLSSTPAYPNPSTGIIPLALAAQVPTVLAVTVPSTNDAICAASGGSCPSGGVTATAGSTYYNQFTTTQTIPANAIGNGSGVQITYNLQFNTVSLPSTMAFTIWLGGTCSMGSCNGKEIYNSGTRSPTSAAAFGNTLLTCQILGNSAPGTSASVFAGCGSALEYPSGPWDFNNQASVPFAGVNTSTSEVIWTCLTYTTAVSSQYVQL